MKSCCCLFYDIYNLQSIDLSLFNTQNVTNMSYMFKNCNNLPRIDLSLFNTQKVTYMEDMFYNCDKLGSIVINIKSSNITNWIKKGKIIYA